jgi:hypothetical protein
MLTLKAKIEEAGYNVDLMETATVETFRAEVRRIAIAAHEEWKRLAQTRLKTSRDIYVNGLRQSESFRERKVGREDVYDITLVGRMPNNFEFGMASFDMKAVRPGWLGGAKAKVSKEGKRYVVIPFRHSTGPSRRFGYTGKAAAARLDREVKKVARDYGLNRMIRTAAGKVVAGPVKRAPNKSPIHSYLRGLTRIQKPTSGTTKTGKQRGQGYLMTWRIMSEKSPADSWIHPGLQPMNLLREVENFVNDEFEKAVERVLGAA